ncbi:Disease resistance protein L6 [Linum grandiflorum]
MELTDSTSVVDATSNTPNPSSSFPSVEYEVFLSFRGPDTRHQITDILYRFLCHTKIHTFKDDNELRKGEEIGSNLLRAIDQSKIYIPIISKSYGDSKWCLIELAEIVRRQEQDPRRIILPIFYMVDPGDVRNQTGPYQNAFQEHVKKFDETTVQSWKDALKKVGVLKGWHVESNDEYVILILPLGVTVDEVSADIWSRISRENLILGTDELVGIDDHVEAVLEKLSLDSKCVTIVGLYGMGGIGKTTTAKAVYNKISSGFDRCCFLENIRETQKQDGDVVVLQKKLVSEILRPDYVGFTNDSGGRKMIKDRLSRSKILVVLDDVDEKFRFEDILGSAKDFISGSRFIVTSRSVNVLRTLNENECKLYEVGSMSHPHSLELFSKHAFRKNTPPPGYETLANDIASSTGGLPLTLKVIGSLLFRQDIEIWEDNLEQLRETLKLDKVLDRLKISYDALEYEAQQIFLDIACFFIGTNKELPSYMWSDYKFYPTSNINILIQRCMIKIGDKEEFQMHDQLRDMGREIVRREDVERPWMRSRIWSTEEGMELLLDRKGSSRVKAISLSSPPSGVKYELKSECFSNLSELKYFDAKSIVLTGDFSNLVPNLRWLQLDDYNHGRLQPLTNFTMKKLVIFVLTESNITDDWGGWTHMKMAKRLKFVRLSRCKGFKKRFCFPMSIEVLSIQSGGVGELDIGELKNLKTLNLTFCEIRKISGGTFGMLKGLRDLRVNYLECTNLRQVVADVGQLSSLKILNTKRAKEVAYEVPIGLKELTTSSRISNLSELSDLEILFVDECKDGINIPPVSSLQGSVWWKVSKLKTLRIRNTRINNIATSLTSLIITLRGEPTWLPSMENLENLTTLALVSLVFQNLDGDLDGVQGLRSLESLMIDDVKGLSRIKGLKDLLSSSTCKLQGLTIGDCPDLIELLPCKLEQVVPSLQSLVIKNCPKLEVGPMIRSLPKFRLLIDLHLLNVNITKEEEELEGLGTLEELDGLMLVLDDTCSLQRIASLSKLQKLRDLVVKVPSLREIEGLAELKSLKYLNLEGCKSLERLWPDELQCSLEKLENLFMENCKSLSAEHVAAVRTSLPPNVRIIWPHQPYNTDRKCIII